MRPSGEPPDVGVDVKGAIAQNAVWGQFPGARRSARDLALPAPQWCR